MGKTRNILNKFKWLLIVVLIFSIINSQFNYAIAMNDRDRAIGGLAIIGLCLFGPVGALGGALVGVALYETGEFFYKNPVQQIGSDEEEKTNPYGFSIELDQDKTAMDPGDTAKIDVFLVKDGEYITKRSEIDNEYNFEYLVTASDPYGDIAAVYDDYPDSVAVAALPAENSVGVMSFSSLGIDTQTEFINIVNDIKSVYLGSTPAVIQYSLSGQCEQVKLIIKDLDGNLIYTALDPVPDKNNPTPFTWDGTYWNSSDSNGKQVPVGAYQLQLAAILSSGETKYSQTKTLDVVSPIKISSVTSVEYKAVPNNAILTKAYGKMGVRFNSDHGGINIKYVVKDKNGKVVYGPKMATFYANNGVDYEKSGVTLNNTVITANGVAQCGLKVFVVDSAKKPLSGISVKVIAYGSGADGLACNNNNGITDSNGYYMFNIKATKPGVLNLMVEAAGLPIIKEAKLKAFPEITIHARSDWNAADPDTSQTDDYYAYSGSLANVYQYNVIHHCATLYVDTWAGKYDELILAHQTFHMKSKSQGGREWGDIGYHFIIDRDGKIYAGRDIGYIGSHVDSANTGKIGVMLLGNYESSYAGSVVPNDNQKKALKKLIQYLDLKYDINDENLKGHRNYKDFPSTGLNNTDCPGDKIMPEIESLKTNLFK